jgi:hypothetical protein
MPIVGGLAWDATHRPWTAFVPLIAFGLISLAIAARLDFPRKRA